MSTAVDGLVEWTETIGGQQAVRLRAGQAIAAGRDRVVIFDGDDTLWETEVLYDVARDVAGRVVAAAGLDAESWRALQLDVDVMNVARFGLLAERFPTSCVEAYEELATQSGVGPDPAVAAEVWQAAASVFSSVARINPAARAQLEGLRRRFHLTLLTQGDPRVQERRVEDSGLRQLFDDIIVVEKKTASVLGDVVDSLGVNRHDAWMVGNSVPSDVNPALEAGMRAIWIDAHVWDHEKREQVTSSSDVTIAEDISRVSEVVLAS